MDQKSQFHRYDHDIRMHPRTEKNSCCWKITATSSHYRKDSKCVFFWNRRFYSEDSGASPVWDICCNFWLISKHLNFCRRKFPLTFDTPKKKQRSSNRLLGNERKFTDYRLHSRKSKIGPWKVGQSFLEPIPLPFIIGRPHLCIVVFFEGNSGEQKPGKAPPEFFNTERPKYPVPAIGWSGGNTPFWSKGILGILYP